MTTSRVAGMSILALPRISTGSVDCGSAHGRGDRGETSPYSLSHDHVRYHNPRVTRWCMHCGLRFVFFCFFLSHYLKTPRAIIVPKADGIILRVLRNTKHWLGKRRGVVRRSRPLRGRESVGSPWLNVGNMLFCILISGSSVYMTPAHCA